MNKQALTRGALAGMAGGVVMAMWSMIVLGLTGSGFWTPLNLIAHTLWRSAPLDASFSVGALVIGLVVHMMMSMVLGMVLAAIVGALKPLGGDQVRRAGTGMVFGIVVWLVMQYLVWKAVDPAAAPLFTPWVFALGHLMYGAVTGLGLARTSADRHAAVQDAIAAACGSLPQAAEPIMSTTAHLSGTSARIAGGAIAGLAGGVVFGVLMAMM